jgi:CheY-like chemotaxis protein
MPYGSVLVVDDVSSNLYVAKGLLFPYGLKIDTAISGYEAINKIKKMKHRHNMRFNIFSSPL